MELAIILVGSFIIPDLTTGVRLVQLPLISSHTCKPDILKNYPAEDTGVHMQGNGARDTVIFEGLVTGVHKGERAGVVDCYINSGSWTITDVSLVNEGDYESGIAVYKNSENEFRFRLKGYGANDVTYKVVLWGQKGPKVKSTEKPYATCCEV